MNNSNSDDIKVASHGWIIRDATTREHLYNHLSQGDWEDFTILPIGSLLHWWDLHSPVGEPGIVRDENGYIDFGRSGKIPACHGRIVRYERNLPKFDETITDLLTIFVELIEE